MYDRVGLISALLKESGWQTGNPEQDVIWLGVSGCPRECVKPPSAGPFVCIDREISVSKLMENIRKEAEKS